MATPSSSSPVPEAGSNDPAPTEPASLWGALLGLSFWASLWLGLCFLIYWRVGIQAGAAVFFGPPLGLALWSIFTKPRAPGK